MSSNDLERETYISLKMMYSHLFLSLTILQSFWFLLLELLFGYPAIALCRNWNTFELGLSSTKF